MAHRHVCLEMQIIVDTKNIQNIKETICLTEDQARYVYKKIETGTL